MPTTIVGIGEALIKEEGDLWQIISQENINISYTEAINMSQTERLCALAAIRQINKMRERSKNKK